MLPRLGLPSAAPCYQAVKPGSAAGGDRPVLCPGWAIVVTVLARWQGQRVSAWLFAHQLHIPTDLEL